MRYANAVTLTLLLLTACEREPSGSAAGPATRAGTAGSAGEVVIYSSIDDPYLRPLMKRFESETGITVRIVGDTEASKSAGLAQRLIAEQDRPQADVYWGNEIFHTINLAEQGIFAPYRPATAQDIPAKWRGKDDLYTCIALRARMIATSTRPEYHDPKYNDHVIAMHGLGPFTEPELKGKIAMANPAFGTTSGHMAALYTAWGEESFVNFLNRLKANEIKLLGSNSEVARQVAAGTVAAGLTDNDDIYNMKQQGGKLDAGNPPDQDEGGTGALLIPGTVALVKGAPHEENARKLIDFLCTRAVEKELIEKGFAMYSVRDTADVRAMNVDYVQAAHNMKKAIELSLTILQSR
jgi:iron(III) transport system substrate-binding protein